MNDITPEENARIAGEFAAFQKAHPEFIFTQRNISLVGEELERLAQAELQANRGFEINATTLEIAANNLISAGKIEIASVPKPKTEAPVTGKYVPFLSDIENDNPHDVVAIQRAAAAREATRKAAEDADLEARKKAAQELFGRTTRTNQEEKPQRIPDSLMDADPAEESRVLQLYDAPEIRRYLERKSFLRTGR